MGSPADQQRVLQSLYDKEPRYMDQDTLGISKVLRKQMEEDTRTCNSPMINTTTVTATNDSMEIVMPTYETEDLESEKQQEKESSEEEFEFANIHEDLHNDQRMERYEDRDRDMVIVNDEKMMKGVESREFKDRGIVVGMYASVFVVQQVRVRVVLEISWWKGVHLKIGRYRNRSSGSRGVLRVVTAQSQNSADRLAELDGILTRNKYALPCTIPYYRRSRGAILIAEIINKNKLETTKPRRLKLTHKFHVDIRMRIQAIIGIILAVRVNQGWLIFKSEGEV
ncbi:hypothetical protein BYT27DRAFT_7217865 [Phlegmacium glaucopus]|nr:hypothetical protein BYT27DRAFT_7217865 [Phlegmacium glaucopus]